MSNLLLPPRMIESRILQDLETKMVFLGGPRQVGKTTFAQNLLDQNGNTQGYYNWDDEAHRKAVRAKAWPANQKLIVLDEIHKAKNWRNLVKGIYDTQKKLHQFLITGSARLDHFRKGGDSLLGRYYYYRMHPYSLSELGVSRENLNHLFRFGGFPEALVLKDPNHLRRWHNTRRSKLVRSDLRDLETVRDLDKVELLAEAMQTRVGTPLSINNLSKDLEVDFKTCKRWIEILDALYYTYRLAPFGAPKIKAVKKEQKVYLWDYSEVEAEGYRFENLVGSHLLRYCHFIEDTQGHRMELRYLRDSTGREIDFVVLQNRKPLFAVECKLSDTVPSPHLFYFKARTPIPVFYQVHLGTFEDQPQKGIHILPFERFVMLTGI